MLLCSILKTDAVDFSETVTPKTDGITFQKPHPLCSVLYKSSRCLTMKAHGGVVVKINVFLTLAIVGAEGQASRSRCFTPLFPVDKILDWLQIRENSGSYLDSNSSPFTDYTRHASHITRMRECNFLLSSPHVGRDSVALWRAPQEAQYPY